MAKLYFRYGTVSSAKTLNLLAVAHAYRQQGKRALLIKPALDTRFGLNEIRSRAGLEEKADILVHAHSSLDMGEFEGAHCVLVDEVQFLSVQIVEQLRSIASDLRIPVICYGLRTDFKTRAFPASARLMEIADSIEEVKTTCAFCAKKATLNLKHSDGVATLDGPAVDLGAEEKYYPACYSCYTSQLQKAGYTEPGRTEFMLPLEYASPDEGEKKVANG